VAKPAEHHPTPKQTYSWDAHPEWYDPHHSTPKPAVAKPVDDHPTPNPQPGPSPTPPPPWSPEDEQKVKELIAEASERHDGDVEEAFADLRDQRQNPSGVNFYDTNLAIAADYFRARWETQKHGPYVAEEQVLLYAGLKKIGFVPQEGPGPVSPYSELQLEYNLQGVADEAAEMSLLEQVWWYSPPGAIYGFTRTGLELFLGEE
jgi:hypothetical protein